MSQVTHSRVPLVLLQIYLVALFLFPSNYVIKAVGAGGYLASLVALALFALWLLTSFLGFHNPMNERSPVLVVFALLWVSTLISYISLISVGTDDTRQLGADRVIMQLAGITGVAFMTTYGVRTKRQLLSLLEVLVWAISITVVIAGLQRRMHVDLTPFLGQVIPGFELNGVNDAIVGRSGLYRVAGTALSPIEFAVACGMVLPIAVVRGIIKSDSGLVVRWLPAVMCLLGAAMSVSRSGVLAVAVTMTALMFMLPAKERFIAFLCLPAALVLLFGIVPGFFATMWEYISNAGADSSVQWRTQDYAKAAELIQQSPWIGHGPSWYMPDTGLDVLDNQFLGTAIEYGVLGVMALIGLLIGPAVIAWMARRRSRDDDLRLVAAAVVSSSLAAVACSAAFDSLAFPMFVGLIALLNGLSGTLLLLTRHQNESDPVTPEPAALAT